MKKSIIIYRTIPFFFAVLAPVWLGLGLFAIPDVNAQASGSPVFLVKSGDSIGGKILEVVAGLENLGRLSYNNHGVVAFRAVWADGAGILTPGIFTQHELLFTSPDEIAGHRVVAVGGPSINDSGVVTFVGYWDDDANGVVDGKGIFTQNDLLFEDGTTIGGLSVEGLSPFDFPVINASGKVAFQATINVPNPCDPPSSCFPRALFTQDHVLVREGDVIGGNVIHYMQAPFKFPTYDFNDAGEVVFPALTDVPANQWAVFTAKELLYKEGEVLNGKTLLSLACNPVINDDGDIAVLGAFGDPVSGEISHRAVLTRAGVLVEDGDIVEGRSLEGIHSTGGMNNLGEVVFLAEYLQAGQLRRGWFTQSRFLVETPVTLDGLEVHLEGIPQINDAGDVVFPGAWDTGGGLWRLEGSGIVRVSRNSPPVAVCADVTVPTIAGACVANAVVDHGSFDPDGDSLTLLQSPAGPYLLGLNPVTLTVTDGHGATASCGATVKVIDQEPPKIANVSADPQILWTPNHKMVDVTVNYSVTDNCTSTPNCALRVASNEPINGTGDGDTSPDWEIVDSHHVKLRAERAGNGTGRIYTIIITCADGASKSSSQNVTVSVPKDQKKK